jgi:tRNA dimethylallyltransferase
MKKAIFITGPTASGKTDLSLYLAKKLGGEIINADSRQVYKNLDYGSGKVEFVSEERIIKFHGKNIKIFFSQKYNIPHYLFNIVNPKNNYSLGRWLKEVDLVCDYIEKNGKKIIFCGGTLLYLKALKEGWILPNVKPDLNLRKNLERYSSDYLFEILFILDKNRAKEIDRKNKKRIIRALEVLYKIKNIPPLIKKPKYNLLIIAPYIEVDILKEKIKKRLKKRTINIVKEIIFLKKLGLTYKRIISFGLEYRWFGIFVKENFKFLLKKEFNFKSLSKMKKFRYIFERCYKDILKFAKRQIREIKKIENVKIIKDKKEALVLCQKFFDR